MRLFNAIHNFQERGQHLKVKAKRIGVGYMIEFSVIMESEVKWCTVQA